MRKALLLIILMLVFISEGVLAENIFVFNEEKISVIEKGSIQELTFFKKAPRIIFRSSQPHMFLAAYPYHSDSLVLFDKNSNVILDQIKVSYLDHNMIDSVNGEDFYFISNGDKSLLVNSYNVLTKKRERLECPGKTSIWLRVSPDNRRVFVLAEEWGTRNRKLVTIGLHPLETISIIDVSSSTFRIFPLDNKQIVLLDIGVEYPKLYQNEFGFFAQDGETGGLKLIDVDQPEKVQEYKFQPKWTYFLRLNTKDRVLTMLGSIRVPKYQGERTEFNYSGRSVLGRISLKGANFYEISSPVWRYEYDPSKDIIYGLTQNKIEVIQCGSNTRNSFQVGKNTFQMITHEREKDLYTTTPYQIDVFPEKDWLLISCNWNGEVKIVDITSQRVIKKIKSGRLPGDINNYEKEGRTIVVRGKEFVYAIAQGNNKINMFNIMLDEVGTIESLGKVIAMYNVNGRPLLVAENGIYKIEHKSVELIYKFHEHLTSVLGYQNKNMVLILNNKDRLVLEQADLSILQHTPNFSNSNKDELIEIKEWND